MSMALQLVSAQCFDNSTSFSLHFHQFQALQNEPSKQGSNAVRSQLVSCIPWVKWQAQYMIWLIVQKLLNLHLPKKGLCRILISNLKGFSRTIQRLKQKRRSFSLVDLECTGDRKPKIPKRKHFLALQEITCVIFFKLFLDVSFMYFIQVLENSHFQGVSSALENNFQIPAFLKVFKHLHGSC